MTEARESDLSALIERARGVGVELWAEGDRLRFRAPPGALAEDVRLALRERRSDVVELLQLEAEQTVVVGPMAANQRGLWLVHQLSPESAAYNLAFSVRILGSVDAAMLHEALQVLVDRHEALRTSYRVGAEGEPERWVHGRARSELKVESAATDPVELRAAVETAHRVPFDLETPPLVRGHLFVGADASVLLVVGHHLAIDGQSLFLLVGEFFEIYGALVDGAALPPPDDSAQFGEFIAWQRRMLEATPPGAAYWREVLTPPPPPLELWPDRAFGSGLGTEGGTIAFVVEGDVALRLRELARSLGATDFALLLAVWTAWLSRWTGEHDLTVGTPVRGRPSVRFEGTIGDFVNVLPLRVDVDPEESFGDLVRRVRKVLLDGMVHQDYPLPLMTSGGQGGAGAPFQTTFVLQDFRRFGALDGLVLSDESARATVGKLTLAPYQLSQQEGQFPLSMEGWSTETGWDFYCRYDASSFDHDTVERRMSEFRTLLQGIAEDPGAALFELPIVPATDRALLAEWNETGREASGGTLVDRIVEHANRTPDAVAVVVGGESQTYEALVTEAARVGAALRGLGVGSGDRVGVLLGRDKNLVPTLLGIMGVGAAYVPMDPRYPSARLEQMLEDSGAVVLVTRGSLASGVDESMPRLDLGTWDRPEPEPFSSVDVESAAYVIYTSGSTGRPKGVEVPHRAVANFLESMAREPGMVSEDVLLAVTTISFDIAVLELYLPLTVGARVVVAHEDEVGDGRRLAELIEYEGVTVLQATPATWKLLVGTGWAGASGLRALCGGEALLPAVAEELLDRVGELWNMYGPTETTVWSTVDRVVAGEPIRIGRPIANTTAYVVDERGRSVPIGAPGELWIGGSGVTHGYVGRPDLTAERFVESPNGDGERVYRTGDLARWRPDGRLEHLGRLDDQVKVRGYRVEPGEIETRIRDHESVDDVVVVARDDRLLAYVVGTRATVETEELRAWVSAALPAYMVPSVFVLLDALPLTPNGKVDRTALPDPDPRASRDGAYEPPATDVEREVARIWAEVLEVDQVGRTDDFFRMGGHSLDAARVVARIAAAFDVEVPLRRFFDHPTVAETASSLGGAEAESVVGLRLAPRDDDGPAPLSFIQERLWFLHQLDPESAAYNMGGAVVLRGAVESERLLSAVDAVFARHEVLRSRVHLDAGRPVQSVGDRPDHDVRVEDARDVPEADRFEWAREQVSRQMDRPYRLEEGALARVSLVRLADDAYLFGLGMHHIAGDQWSVGVLLEEIAALYNGAAELPELRLQYTDYAAWQRDLRTTEALAASLDHWRTELAGLSPLDLPTDQPRGRVMSSAGAAVHQRLPAEMSDQVAALARDTGVTPFVTLLSAFAALLRVHAGQEDFAIGVPVASRPHAELERLVGAFLNVLAHRVDVSADPTFRELMVRTRERTLDATTHQHVPFELLVQELDVGRDTSRHPLIQVLFSLANTPLDTGAFGGLEAEPILLERGSAQFELSMHVHEDLVYLEYNSDLFDRGTAQRLLGHYVEILKRAIDDPDAPVSALTSPSTTDRVLLSEWNETEVPYPLETTLIDVLLEQMERTPDSVAVVAPGSDGVSSLTYAELEARSRSLAARLQGLGVSTDVPVAVVMERSVELVVALVAVLRAGGAYVPVDPDYPPERRRFMLEDSGAPVVLTHSRLADEVAGTDSADFVMVDEVWAELASEATLASGPRADGLAYVIYTSGSTGLPKGAMIEHRSIVNRLRWMQSHFGLDADDVVLQKTPYSFDVSVWEFFWPLMTGARLVMARPEGHKDPGYLAHVIEAEGVTTLHFVPSMLSVFLETVDLGGAGSLVRVICSGEELSPSLRDRFFDATPHASLTNLYGPTEAAVDVSWWACSRDDRARRVPIGRPVANTRLYVLDEELRPMPVGAPGELFIGGVQVGRGYWRRPDLTRERFLESPFHETERLYRTGDRARFLADGSIEYLGRLDHQLKIRGFRVEPGEIEARLVEHPVVKQAVVIARRDVLLAYAVSDGEGIGAEDLERWVADALPSHMVPSAFVLLDALPLTPNGKVDRTALPDPDPRASRDGAYEPPATDVEREVARIWAEVLEVDQVGRTDDFFRMGGHSLLVPTTMQQIRDRIGVDLSVAELFRTPVLGDLSKSVEAALVAVLRQPAGGVSDGDETLVF